MGAAIEAERGLLAAREQYLDAWNAARGADVGWSMLYGVNAARATRAAEGADAAAPIFSEAIATSSRRIPARLRVWCLMEYARCLGDSGRLDDAHEQFVAAFELASSMTREERGGQADVASHAAESFGEWEAAEHAAQWTQRIEAAPPSDES